MSQQRSDQLEVRLQKLSALEEMGINPYPSGWKPTHTAAEIIKLVEEKNLPLDEENRYLPLGDDFCIAGRIMRWGKFGKAAFTHLADRTGKLQVYFRKDVIGESYAAVKKFDLGDIVGVKGRLFHTKTGELTIEVIEFTFLGKSLRPLPEKWHGLTDVETRFRQRYLDLIVNPEVREIFVKRSKIISYIRDFLVQRDFFEVETPMMQPLPGGAAARPFITHHNALNIDLYLRIAPELYLKRLIVGGLERVFEINRNFRNEGLDREHNPEFTMLEFYWAYADYEDLIKLTEDMISGLVQELFGKMTLSYQETELDFSAPWQRMTMMESLVEIGKVPQEVIDDETAARAFAEEKHIKIDKSAGHGKVLVEIFEELVEPNLVGPVFITQYPVEVSPLARRNEDSPEFTDRFELFVCGREIANAFSELADPRDQRSRFEAQANARAAGDDEAQVFDEDFVTALEYGMPPAAGEGIGIDRLVMLLTDSASIREVILFPHLKPKDNNE
jgi:lysyl-tRNA synthetase, class II